jgi:hypothetical protein
MKNCLIYALGLRRQNRLNQNWQFQSREGNDTAKLLGKLNCTWNWTNSTGLMWTLKYYDFNFLRKWQRQASSKNGKWQGYMIFGIICHSLINIEIYCKADDKQVLQCLYKSLRNVSLENIYVHRVVQSQGNDAELNFKFSCPEIHLN